MLIGFGVLALIVLAKVVEPREVDPWIVTILRGAALSTLVAYVVLRAYVSRASRSRRISWSNWAWERGFEPAPRWIPDETRLHVLFDGRDRDWQGPYTGRVGDRQAWVGATAWTTGTDKHQTRHRLFIAVVELSEEAARQFPATSVTHFMRGFLDLSIALPISHAQELRLESIDVDLGCEIRVAGDADHVRWRELFDAPLVHALADALDVQWVQQGRWLLCCAAGTRQSTAPVETLDTLATGAEFVARWMDHVADRRATDEQRDVRAA